jgi:phosphate/sulfate permease
MIEIAGLFIIAEAVMYFLILNVWYQTWDFIALDSIVTPLVGLLALGSGSFFIYKYYSSRDKALTCDVTSVEHQSKVENRIRELATKPLTLAVALAVIGLAFSVNVIEFACSIGIPQAFTKVLELNNLSFIEYQGYTMLYTLFYMADDFIVFALAIWGYSKFYAVGQKYSRYATLVAGILMLALGALLVFSPDILAF